MESNYMTPPTCPALDAMLATLKPAADPRRQVTVGGVLGALLARALAQQGRSVIERAAPQAEQARPAPDLQHVHQAPVRRAA